MLVTVVTGCGRAPRYDGRLVTADSLMRSDPDSALTIVEGTCRDSLATPGDRAYRDLLLTQARYRCYVTATSDSTINRALDYYTAHPDEREKLTRAHIYKGAVMGELGHPDSAMLHYKLAEAVADTTDYFNLGYANMRMAQLYQSCFVNDSAVVDRMKLATRFFTLTRDTSYLITTIGTQGAYYDIISQDSAYICLEKAILLAKEIKSPKGLQYQSKLAGLYFYDGNYSKAKELAMDIVRNGKGQCNEQQFYYYAARSFIHLNETDSARWLLQQIPPPHNSVDSMNLNLLLAELSTATHHLENYVPYSDKAKEIEISIFDNARQSNLPDAEKHIDISRLIEHLRSQINRHLFFVIAVSMLLVILLAFLAYRIANRRITFYRRQLDSALRELEMMIAENNRNTSQLASMEEHYKIQIQEKDRQLAELNGNPLARRQETPQHGTDSDFLRHRNAMLKELYSSIKVKSVTKNGGSRMIPLISAIKEFCEQHSVKNKPLPNTFWDNLQLTIDGEFHGIASFVKNRYTNLSEKDYRLFMLLCADFPNLLIKICLDYSHDVTVSKNKKKLINDKIGFDGTVDDYINAYLQGKIAK